MKALTLMQPWASAIAMGYKRVETRSWGTNYRGPLAIHAGLGFPAWAKEFASEELAVGRLTTPLPRGAVVCVAWLVGCERTEDVAQSVSALDRRYGDFTTGRWAWMLEDVEVLSDPVPARGALGLWEWKPDPPAPAESPNPRLL